ERFVTSKPLHDATAHEVGAAETDVLHRGRLVAPDDVLGFGGLRGRFRRAMRQRCSQSGDADAGGGGLQEVTTIQVGVIRSHGRTPMSVCRDWPDGPAVYPTP